MTGTEGEPESSAAVPPAHVDVESAQAEPPPSRRRKPAAIGLLACIGLAAALLPFGAPLWWFGAGFAAAALVLAAPRLRTLAARLDRPAPLFRSTWRNVAAEACCIGVLVVVATVMAGPYTLGDYPVDHDHTVHLYKAWQTKETFLPEGRIHGWSQSWFAGDPVNYLYPFGGDLWVIGVWAATFGLLEFGTAYGLALWLFWFLSGYAVYRLGARVFGRGVGLVAGLFALTDFGGFRAGGWSFAMDWGVWPQSLSTAFGILAIAQLPDILDGRRWSPVARFGLFMGFALLGHPSQLFLFVLAVPIALAARTLTAPRAPWAAPFGRTIVAAGIAFAIGALYFLPFLDTQHMASSYGALWTDPSRMAGLLLDGKLFEGTHYLPLALGVLGTLALLRSSDWPARFVALVVVLFLAISSVAIVDELHLFLVSDAFANVQYERFAILLKPFAFVAAAFGLIAIFRAARAHGAGHAPIAGSAVIAFCAATVAAPIALPVASEMERRFLERDLTPASERELLEQRGELVEWARTHMPIDGVARWAFFVGNPDHSLVDLGIELDAPTYKASFMPASIYMYKIGGRHPDTLRALNVRWVVSKTALTEPHLELRKAFGSLRVYEFRDWTSEPFQVLEGAGHVELVEFADERVVLDVAPGAHGRMQLNVSWFPRWHATRDGEPVRIDLNYGSPIRGSGFMTVPLAPGRYVFEFRRSFTDYLALVLCALGLLAAAALFVRDRRRPAAEHPSRLAARLDQRHWIAPALVVLVLAGAAAAGLALGAWTPALADGQRPPDTWIRAVRYDFLEKVRAAQVSRGTEPCSQQLDRHVCGDQAKHDVAPSNISFGQYDMQRCLAAPVKRGDPLRIRFPDVPAGDAIVGWFGIARTSSAGEMKLRVLVDGAELYDGKISRTGQKQTFDARLPEGHRENVDVVFEVSGKRDNDTFCFRAQMATL